MDRIASPLIYRALSFLVLATLPFSVLGCQPQPPSEPVLQTQGNEITLAPTETRAISAQSRGAKRWDWKLAGEGEITGNITGPTILYTAPAAGGETAVLTVTAFNEHGASPSSSLTIRTVSRQSVPLSGLSVIPAGWMAGEGSPSDWIEKVPTPASLCGSDANCVGFTYKTGAGWAGIFWWPVGCGGSGTAEAFSKVRDGSCGIDVPMTANMKTVERLVFEVIGARGSEVVQFAIGDSSAHPSIKRTAKESPLTTEWATREIELGGLDLSTATVLFSWVATDDANPEGATFYLRNIRFEGIPASFTNSE